MSRVPASELHTLWVYADPALSEERFIAQIALAEAAGAKTDVLEYRTQQARTHSLRGQFDRATALLDAVEPELPSAPSVAGVRYQLERGRTARSSGDIPASIPFFQKAFDDGSAIGSEFLTVDAAHMLAIAHTGKTGRDWHLRAIELARASRDDRARGWLGSLLNNLGWDLHDAGELEAALALFEECRAEKEARGQVKGERIGRYSIARTLRSLERYDDALAILEPLQVELDKADAPDGYVREELGEVWLAKGESDKATPHFAAAYRLLSKDGWLTKNEPDRVKRLGQLGGVAE